MGSRKKEHDRNEELSKSGKKKTPKKEEKSKKLKRKRESPSNTKVKSEKKAKSTKISTEENDKFKPTLSTPKRNAKTLSFRESDGNPFFHGLTALELPSSKVVQQMDSHQQHEHITSLGKDCEKIISLLLDCLTSGNNQDGETENNTTTHEQMIADMARLKRVSLAKQYVEMTLWRRIKQSNRKHLAMLEKLGYGLGMNQQHSSGNIAPTNDGAQNDPELLSYKDKFLKGVLNNHSEELDKVREKESLDADDVAYMVTCLEAGSDLYANLTRLDEQATDEMK